MPGEFVDQGCVRLDPVEAEEGLRAFVHDVIQRLDEGVDPRETQLREDWEAIANADNEERDFCRAAGTLGLDPYRADDWPPGIATLIEDQLGDSLQSPIAVDFLEAVDAQHDQAAALAQQWKWATETNRTLDLQSAPSTAPSALSSNASPATIAYRLAKEVRRSTLQGRWGRLTDVGVAAESLNLGGIQFEARNHLPGREIQAAVGWRRGREPIVAGPPVAHSMNLRFLEARGLYHAAFACHDGPRLITSAHTWDQKASRAFAAELLAPQAELVAEVDDVTSPDDLKIAVDRLAAEYDVSVKVIEHQLENAGFTLDTV
jgi:hypothetical protein